MTKLFAEAQKDFAYDKIIFIYNFITLYLYMKSLQLHIIEKLVIFPSQVNEKLGINKNTKLISANEIFYEEFKDVLDKNSDFGWFKAKNIKDILSIAMPKDWGDEAKKFFGDNKLYVKYTGTERDNTTYENMMKFVTGGGFRTDNEFMDFTYKNITSKLTRDYKIYLFDTDNLKIGLWGWMYADKFHEGTMTFQYK